MVEILVSITLMGIVVASVLPALSGAIGLSKTSNDQAKIAAVLGSAVEKISSDGWRACPEVGGGYAPKAKEGAATVGWPESTVTVDVLDIRYWDPGSKSFDGPNLMAGSCDSAGTDVDGENTLQLVTVRVTSPDGKLTRELDVVMGDLAATEAHDASD